MDSTRMRKYAIQNNISIKQSELDTKTALIDKRGAFEIFSLQ
jgi:outer membrane protein